VALGIDQRRVPGVLATLAGDDTIFVATAKGMRPAKLAKQLEELWK
jgi:arginine repressor